MSSRPRNIIFDMDGTLADSITTLLEVANDLGVLNRRITRADYERSKNLSVKDIFKEFEVPIWRAPALVVKGRAALAHRINDVPFFAGMDVLVQELSKDHRLFVMSSNSLENIQKFLENHGINESFESIYGGVGIFGKSRILRKAMKEHGLAAVDTYYVGDEVRDIEAAKKAGVRSVAVTWGFNGEEILRKRKPDYIVHNTKELQEIFVGNNENT